MFLVSASPQQAFIDALKRALEADATLMALVTGVYGHVPEASRVTPPYIVFGYEHEDQDGAAGAMGLAGSRCMVTLDVWSKGKGKSEVRSILSRIYTVLERRTLHVTGFRMMDGSLTREFQDIDDEPDADSPTLRLYHGIQRWGCVVDEAA
jgi:hypothetical protein